MRAVHIGGLLAALTLVGCNHFGNAYSDVCGQFPGQTCIALGLGCSDDESVDQIYLTTTTPGLLPPDQNPDNNCGHGYGALTPSLPNETPLILAAEMAIVPLPSVETGWYSITAVPFYKGNQVAIPMQLAVPVVQGQTTYLQTDKNVSTCFADVIPTECNGCVGCCVDNKCIQAGMSCQAGATVCVQQTGCKSYECVPCGGAQQSCCEAQKCTTGCCDNGVSRVGECIDPGTICSNSTQVLSFYCIAQQAGSQSNTCTHCGDRGEVCCPNAASACSITNDCCDPTSNRCVGPTDACGMPNTTCQVGKGCAECGKSGELCCAPSADNPSGPRQCQDTSTMCDGVTGKCP